MTYDEDLPKRPQSGPACQAGRPSGCRGGDKAVTTSGSSLQIRTKQFVAESVVKLATLKAGLRGLRRSTTKARNCQKAADERWKKRSMDR
jgi:hypothetical protein